MALREWWHRPAHGRRQLTVGTPDQTGGSAIITASGTSLEFRGRPYIPLGMNVWYLAGPGNDIDMGEYFSSLPPNCLTRIWCSQATTQPASGPGSTGSWTWGETGPPSGQATWEWLDTVFDTAASYTQLLLPSLSVWSQPQQDTASARGDTAWVSGAPYTEGTWAYDETYYSLWYYCTTSSAGSGTPPHSDAAHWSIYQGIEWFNGGYSSLIEGQCARSVSRIGSPPA